MAFYSAKSIRDSESGRCVRNAHVFERIDQLVRFLLELLKEQGCAG